MYYVQSDPSSFDDGIRVAVITGVHNDEGLVSLSVFRDATYDHQDDAVKRATSVSFSARKEPGTWHWPERVGGQQSGEPGVNYSR